VLSTDNEYGDLLPNVNNIINPSILLESERFARLLDVLAERYRYVFLDVPPLGLVSDAERIGHLCDGAILTVRSGVTPKSIIRSSAAQLERAGCPLLGVVLNRAGSGKGAYYKKYYGKYYGSKYGEEYYKKTV
jgi:Mrp family chromosome partitioning ATPase